VTARYGPATVLRRPTGMNPAVSKAEKIQMQLPATPLCLLFVALGATSALSAQHSWLQRLAASAPSPRAGHVMCFDSARGQVVLFGGGANADTWEYNGTNWVHRTPVTAPFGGALAMAFDSARGVAVLVTGSGGTWEWNGIDWVQRATGLNPVTGQIAFDSVRGRTVLLGRGVSQALPAITWEWDGTSWQSFTTATGPYFTGQLTTMTFDGQSCAVHEPFLGAPTGLGWEMWRWDGAAWTVSACTSTPYLSGAKLCYAGPIGTVLYGGTANGSPVVGTYLYSGDFATTPTFASPGPRSGHAMAYDSARQRLVLFGGYWLHPTLSVQQLRNDTWELALPAVTATATTYGQGCGTPPLQLTPQSGSRPVQGTAFVAEVTNGFPGLSAVAWGFSNQLIFSAAPLPLAADSWGLQGCQLWTSTDSLGDLCADVGGVGQYALNVPNDPLLVGAEFYLQAYSFRPGQNALEIVLSNGMQISIGDV
jgi:hypothetical protein